MRFRIGLALLCCSAICCVAQLILHLHLAWLCNCVCCIQGNTFSSMYFAECFVFRNFRLFLHRCEPHVRPWLLDMRLATVCMSMYGPVYSICTQKPKPIWAWNAVNCEPVVACGSELGWHFYAVRQFAVWHN